MKKQVIITFVIVLLHLSLSPLGQAQTAILYSSNTTVIVKVDLAPNILPSAQPTIGGLYAIDENGNWNQLAPLPKTISSPFTQFEIRISRSQYNPKHEHQIVVFGSFKDKDGVTTRPSQNIPVTLPLVLSLVRDQTNCPDGITLLAQTELGAYDWNPYYQWVSQYLAAPAGIATINIQKSGGSPPIIASAKSVVVSDKNTAQVTGNSRICILTDPSIPNVAFSVTLTLNPNNLPADVAGQASAQGLGPAYAVAFPKRDDFKEDTSKRVLERNLDLGVSLTSSVADEEIAATDTTPKHIVRKRTTRGILDVRFAPWMDIVQPVITENAWLHFFTPIYLNANVATGKITKDTLALNRVLIGFEGESRYYTSRRWVDEDGEKRHSNPIWHRIKWGGQHASDRDFKQDEFTGRIEYAPIFEVLYNPYKFNFSGKSGEKVQNWYGYTFQPKAGFEIGRTYHRNKPAAAIEPSKNVRRFYFGADLGFDLTQYTSFTFSDLLFIRGELPKNRSQNYFKGSFDFVFRPSNVTSSGVFASFERGQLPPFANPSVNVFKIGYRLVSNYCKEACR